MTLSTILIISAILITYYLLPSNDINKSKEIIGPLEEKLSEFNNQVRVIA